MTKKTKEAFFEAIKEPARLLVLAIIPTAIVWLTELGYEWAIIATAVLRALDKFLHQLAPKGKANGLVRF